ncbi:hypothetical protein [Nostoc sp.]
MSESQATWSLDGSHIPDINPHTKAKHQILETYLEIIGCISQQWKSGIA